MFIIFINYGLQIHKITRLLVEYRVLLEPVLELPQSLIDARSNVTRDRLIVLDN